MSPYHHFGIPNKSSSVDSIVTITTLAEDDVDLVVGRVAGWCGLFDKLLSDPLGLQYFLVSCFWYFIVSTCTYMYCTCKYTSMQ